MRHPVRYAVLVCAALALAACSATADERDGRAPTVPGGVTAQAGSATSVHVMWEASADDKGVTGYEVLQRGARVKAVPGEKHMTDVDGLAPATAYSFTVRARDAAGNLSAPSAPVAVTTPAPTPADHGPPTAPGALRGRADGSRAVTLSWRRATDDVGVTSYDIYQEDVRIHSVSGSATGARVTGLRPGTVYTFTVRARDAADNSSPDSDPVDLTTAPAPGAPASTAPTELSARYGEAAGVPTVELSWRPPDTGGPVTSYQLFLDGRFTTTIVFGAGPPPGRASYTLTVAAEKPGTRYSVKLRARLPDGTWGDLSAQRTVVIGGRGATS
ncbi:fibronectin type III domain-containing protein [Streptomyces sp. NPDC023838]|uniref:fibronectin type III domain-containing protein n=1 Tax=Streptomyces sp. NPDC023838 TaxID=3154325 RepID=UPI0033C501DC